MKLKNFNFDGYDGKKITGFLWKSSGKPKAILQIAHGQAEHAERYDEFAQALNKAGYTVYANDHRGHGKTAGSVENCGFFAEKKGWDLVQDDMYELTKVIKKENKNLPVFLLGHSMGSFLTRTYLFKYSNEIKGAILSGTAGDPGLLGAAGKLIASIEEKMKGPKKQSPLMDKLSFGAFNNAFKPNRTEFDWLSSVNEEVDKYIADPYCGNIHSNSYFKQLLQALKESNDEKNIAAIRKDLPIYLFSGALDPVGMNTKGVTEVFQKYIKAGIQDVSLKFYGQCRHETLNEFNKKEVYQDIINWLDSKYK